MRPRLKRFTQFARGFALCSTLFSLCASAGHAQGISASRAAAGARYGTGLAGLESLEAIQSQPAPSSRVRIQAETISVHEFLVPGGAIKEFQRSQKAVRSGNFESAAEHLQKALQIYPNFVQAHNNLGANYIQLNEYERAIPEFQKAIELDPKILEAYRNLGLGLFLLGRYPEAETAARQAMQLNPRLGLARYTLGRILAAEGSTSRRWLLLDLERRGDFPSPTTPTAIRWSRKRPWMLRGFTSSGCPTSFITIRMGCRRIR